VKLKETNRAGKGKERRLILLISIGTSAPRASGDLSFTGSDLEIDAMVVKVCS